MNTSTTFDRYMERIEAGDRLAASEIHALATTPDILPLGMRADSLRRQRHGVRTTFLRVATCPIDAQFTERVPSMAREVRLTGSLDQLPAALDATARAKAAADGRWVSAFSWSDVERFADGAPAGVRN